MFGEMTRSSLDRVASPLGVAWVKIPIYLVRVKTNLTYERLITIYSLHQYSSSLCLLVCVL